MALTADAIWRRRSARVPPGFGVVENISIRTREIDHNATVERERLIKLSNDVEGTPARS
ncbi:hypothetical protein AB0B69_01045 [Micromonospora parva]|uniref:hypothetical protein n=1 Tax=Micromonospora parva TaxID=1464048 RepID=UPI00340A0E2A